MHNISTSQTSKSVCASMCNILIGKPWQMLATDILKVLVSHNNRRYLVVVMDYFTKWVEAIPLRDQAAAWVTKAIIKICSTFGVSSILHSDQGCNFESDMLRKMIQAFGYRSLVPLLITRSVMEWWSNLTAHYYSCCDAMSVQKRIGKAIFHWCCMRIVLSLTQQQVYLLSS